MPTLSSDKETRPRTASASALLRPAGSDPADPDLSGLSVDFRALFESWPGSYLVLDPDLVIIAVSDAYLRASMSRRPDVIGRNMFEAFPDNPDDPQADGVARLGASLDQVRRHRVTDTMAVQKYDIRRPGSGEFEARYWSVVNSPVLDRAGEVIYIIIRAEDITEYIQLKERQSHQPQPVEGELQIHVQKMETEILARALDLQETNRELQRLAAIVEHADDAILTNTVAGIITSWNVGAEKLYGYTERESLGQPASALVPHGYDDEVPAMLKATVSARKAVHGDTVRLRKDGTLVDVALALSPILDASGEVVEVASISRDITERRRTEGCLVERSRQLETSNQSLVERSRQLETSNESLVERSRQLETSNEELEKFAYIASHDLQEPLRKMASFSQLLARRYQGQLDERADQYIAYIVDGAIRLQDLINDLLTFSRIGRSHEVLGVVDCGEVVDRVRIDLAAAVEQDRASIVVIGTLPKVYGELTRLVQLFQNLIGNAIKFHGQEEPRIEISAVPEGTGWRFSIADNGIGIDPQYADRIFGLFQRLHTRAEYPGTGIGLALCKKIVEGYGGTLCFESRPGAGTTFYWTMPGEKVTS
jgi:PAS domain S-box-containing protein